MRVLHVLASNKYSGAENVACQIIKMFDGEVEMAYCSPDGEIAKSLHEKGIKFFPLQKLSKKNLKKVVEEFKPDVIHAHDLKASYIAFGFKQCKRISTIHVNHPKMRKLSLRSLLALKILNKFDHVFWVSKSCLDGFYFKNRLKPECTILSNIINTEKFKNNKKTNEKEYDVLFVGRLTEQKDPIRLTRIAKKLVDSNPQIKIAIVGNGEMFDEIKEIVSNDSLKNSVFLLGFISDISRVMKNSKLLLMTSKFEGTPMCALEALAAGLPIVSTRTDGMCQLIVNGKNGFLYDTDDQATDMIKSLLNNVEILQKISKNCCELSDEINNIEHYKSTLLKGYVSS